MKRTLIFLYLFLMWLVTITSHATDGGVESLRRTSKAFALAEQEVSLSAVSIRVESKAATNYCLN